MKYALLTPKGKVYTFYVLALAETYQTAYGGQLISLLDQIGDIVKNDLQTV